MKTSQWLLLAAIPLAAANGAAPEKMASRLSAMVTGEFNAAHRYELFSAKARQEGYPQIAKLFAAAARAEAIHRAAMKTAARSMGVEVEEPGLAEVTAGSTAENLKTSAQNELSETTKTYPALLADLKQEKDSEAAIKILTYAIAAEAQHAQLFKEALANLGKNPEVSFYLCPVCSYLSTAKPAGNCAGCKGEHKPISLPK